jgi:hypothetical protein
MVGVDRLPRCERHQVQAFKTCARCALVIPTRHRYCSQHRVEVERAANAANQRNYLARRRARSAQVEPKPNGRASWKLVPEVKEEVRRAYANGEGGYLRLSRRFGVLPTTIKRIVKKDGR